MGRYKKITLTTAQEEYVRANYATMTSYQIAEHLKISQGKVMENVHLMGLRKAGKTSMRKRYVVPVGFFDEMKYAKSCFIMSKIEWTEETWNPLVGCTKVSAGCKNCYAMRMAWRLMHNPKMKDKYAGTAMKTAGGEINWTGKINMNEDELFKPIRTKKPTVFFVNSMSDLFHEGVDFEYINQVFAIMAVTPQHTYQILTKRPQVMLEWAKGHVASICTEIDVLGDHFDDHPYKDMGDECLRAAVGIIEGGWPLKNVWLGVSVEDQKAADERIPLLLQMPAAVRFLSCEPLLGELDIAQYLQVINETGFQDYGGPFGGRDKLSWVIAGGESGPGARPMHPDWIRSLRDRCNAAAVPFFFKQWGEWYTSWANISDKSDHPFVFKLFTSYTQFTQKDWVNEGDACISIDGTLCKNGGDMKKCKYPVAIMQKVGKKKAGRLLDGQLHDAMPISR